MADEKSARATAGRPLERFAKVDIDGIMVHYRECGPKDAPAILLLHGFPSSGHMFRSLIPMLCDDFRLVAPDFAPFAGDIADGDFILGGRARFIATLKGYFETRNASVDWKAIDAMADRQPQP